MRRSPPRPVRIKSLATTSKHNVSDSSKRGAGMLVGKC